MSLTLAFDVGYLPSLSELDSTSADPFNRGYCWLLLFDVEEWGTILSKGGYSPLMSVSALRLLAQDYQLTSERLLIKRTSGNFYHITRAVAGTPAYMCVSAQNALSIKPVPGNGPFFEEVVFGGRYINWDRVSLPRMSSPWYDVSAFAQMIRVAFSEPFDKQAHRESIDAQLNVVSVRGVVGPTQRFRASGVFINSASGSWSRYMQQLRMAANYKDRAKDQKVKQPSTRGSRDDDREPRRTETEYDYSDALVSFGKATGTMMRDMYSGIGVYDRETFELHFGLKWIYDVGEEDDTEHPVWKHFSLTVHVCSLMPWFISSVMQDLHDKLETKNPMLAIDRSVIATELAAAMTTEDNSPYMKDRDYYENLQNNGFITPLYGDWSNKIVSLFLVAGFRDPFKDEKVIRELTMSSGDVNDMMTNFSHVLRRINTQLGSCDGVWTPKKWSRAHNMYLRTGTPPGVPPTITWKKVLRQFIEQTEVHQDDIWVSKQVGTETEPTYLPPTDRVLVRDLVNAKDNSFTGVGFYLYVDVVEEGVNRKIKGCFAFEFDVLKYALKFIKFLHPNSGESDGFDDDPDDDDGKEEEETQLTMSQTDRTNMLAAMAAVSGGDTVGSRSVSPSGSQRDSDNDVHDIGVPLVKPTNLNEQVWDFMSVEERRKFLKFIKRNQRATGKAKRNNFRLAVGLRLKSDGFVDDESELQEFLSDREKFRQKHSSTSSSV